MIYKHPHNARRVVHRKSPVLILVSLAALLGFVPAQSNIATATPTTNPAPSASPTPSATPPPSTTGNPAAQPTTGLNNYVDAISLAGTSYLPSPLSPPLTATLWIVIAFLCWRIFRRITLGSGERVRSEIVKIGLLLLLVLLLLLIPFVELNYWNIPSIPAVAVDSLPLPSQANTQAADATQTGYVVGAMGVGRVQQDNGRLRVRGLARAGKYEGKVDFLPQADKGEVKVTVTVADWFPYALLSIAAGVLLGYWITRYYKQQRGADEQRVGYARLWQQIAQDESAFQLKHFGALFAKYRIAELARVWIAQAVSSIDAGDAASAKLRIDKLKAYVTHFTRFRRELEQLDEARSELQQQIAKCDFGLAITDVDVLCSAERALDGAPLDAQLEDDERTQLKARELEVVKAIAWARSLRDTHTSILRHLEYARYLGSLLLSDDAKSDDAKKKLAEQAAKLRDAGRAALLADSEEKAREQNVAADAARVELGKLREAIPLVSEREEAVSLLPLPPSIELEILTPDDAASNNVGDRDDLFVFRTTLTFERPLNESFRARWDFDDDTLSPLVTISSGKVGEVHLETSHRFAEGGTYSVRLEDERGYRLADHQVEVKRDSGRWQKRLAAFQLTDRQMTIIAGLLTIGSGFLTLYVKNPQWGTPSDYLTALLWGSVISEGSKYVVNLANRVLPLT